MKKGVFLGVILFVGLLVIPVVSAEILMGQISSLYNKGDNFAIDITLSPNIDTRGFFTAKLICYGNAGEQSIEEIIAALESANSETQTIGQTEINESANETGNEITGNESASESEETETTSAEEILTGYSELEIYKSPEGLRTGEKKIISISAPLDYFFIGDARGECFVRANFGNDEADSQTFSVTKNIGVDFDVSGIAFNPGENFSISGTAVKGNGKQLEGYVSITISGLGINISTEVVAGQFSSNVAIPSNAPAGEYNVIAHAYEKDLSGEIINEGAAGNSFKVNQIIKDIGLVLNSQTITPGTELTYTILLFDQAGTEAEEDTSVVIYDNEDEISFEGLVKSGITSTFLTYTNSSPGYWTIEAASGEHKIRKQFYIEELKKISYSITNDTITITNVGNVLYDKPIEITIGDTKKVKDVKLKVGESAVFELSAPDGEYDILVSDGENSENLGRAALTGKTISVSEIGSGLLNFWWLWILILVLLLIIAALLIRRHRKKKQAGFASVPSAGAVGGAGSVTMSGLAGSSGAISGGRKEETSVVALKIKNYEQLAGNSGDGSAVSAINKALLVGKEERAKIYVDGSYRIMIFSQLITKEADNNIKAIKIAQAVQDILDEHNNRYNQKIDFGIGVNSGEMIVEIKDSKFSFTSLGNTIGMVKKIAGDSGGEVLISEMLHRKVIGKVKSTKMPTGENWKVRSVADREQYSSFVDNFRKKQQSQQSNPPSQRKKYSL